MALTQEREVESGLSFGAKLLVSVFGARRRSGETVEEAPGRDAPRKPNDAEQENGTDEGDAADGRDDRGQG